MTTVCSVSGSYGARRSTTERIGRTERGERKGNRTEGERGKEGEDRGRRKIKDTISSVNIIRIQL